MNRIDYKVTEVVEKEKSMYFEDESFICVEHRVDGIIRYTAFIGNSEGDNSKRSITVSPSGGLLEISRMAGSAVFNAEILLKKNAFNSIILNSRFIELYRREKAYWAREL